MNVSPDEYRWFLPTRRVLDGNEFRTDHNGARRTVHGASVVEAPPAPRPGRATPTASHERASGPVSTGAARVRR
ncbi:hypothetical protein GCM10009546_29380 [Actinomadura livida]|uniref:Uncharacterized protein n=1 Tax=Actinomadura livida TaxID=79909 RepID=A0ABN1EF23_9ACTN|nr:hypothetical protein GCM10010208_33800 [Actinomadura livida]